MTSKVSHDEKIVIPKFEVDDEKIFITASNVDAQHEWSFSNYLRLSPSPTLASGGRILNFRRATFLGIVVLLLVGGIIGGAVGGSRAAKNAKLSTPPSSPSSPTSSPASFPPSAPPSPVPTAIGSVATSTDGTGEVNLQVYYEDTTGSIWLNQHSNPVWTGFGRVYVDPNTKHGTPLAAISWSTDSGEEELRLYYLDPDNNICEAASSCSDSNSCAWRCKAIGPKSGSGGPAALNIGGDRGIRVYYLDDNATVSEVAYEANTGRWKVGAELGQQAAPGSSLAADVLKTTTSTDPAYLDVFCTAGSGDPTQIPFRGAWNTGATVWSSYVSDSELQDSIAVIASWNPTAYRVYHFNSTSGLRELQSNPSTEISDYQWASKWDYSHHWLIPDIPGGPIAAIGWVSGETEIRLYYSSGGNIVEAALDSGRWAATSLGIGS